MNRDASTKGRTHKRRNCHRRSSTFLPVSKLGASTTTLKSCMPISEHADSGAKRTVCSLTTSSQRSKHQVVNGVQYTTMRIPWLHRASANACHSWTLKRLMWPGDRRTHPVLYKRTYTRSTASSQLAVDNSIDTKPSALFHRWSCEMEASALTFQCVGVHSVYFRFSNMLDGRRCVKMNELPS